MAERSYELEDGLIIDALINMKRLDIAAEHLVDGHLLLVPPRVALRIAMRFKIDEMPELAERLFELSEPLGLLFSGPRYTTSGEEVLADLKAWAEAAVYFKPMDLIIRSVMAIPAPSDQEQVCVLSKNEIVTTVLFYIGRIVLDENRSGDFDQIRKSLDQLGDGAFAELFWFRVLECEFHLHANRREEASMILDTLAASDFTLIGRSGFLRTVWLRLRIQNNPVAARASIADMEPPLPELRFTRNGTPLGRWHKTKNNYEALGGKGRS